MPSVSWSDPSSWLGLTKPVRARILTLSPARGSSDGKTNVGSKDLHCLSRPGQHQSRNRGALVMIKTRMLVGLAALLGVLALSATPAFAEFQSRNGTSHGPSQLVAGKHAVFSPEPGGIPLECEAAPDEWKIRKIESSQEPQLKGGHLNLSVTFEKCSVKILLMTVKIPNIACELELVQVKGSAKEAIGQVLSECAIKVPINGCEIKVPPLSGTKNSE